MESLELNFYTSEFIQIVDIRHCDHVLHNGSYSFYHFHSFSPVESFSHPFYTLDTRVHYRLKHLDCYDSESGLSNFTRSFDCMVIKLCYKQFFNVFIIRMNKEEFVAFSEELKDLVDSIKFYQEEHQYFIVKERIMKREYIKRKGFIP